MHHPWFPLWWTAALPDFPQVTLEWESIPWTSQGDYYLSPECEQNNKGMVWKTVAINATMAYSPDKNWLWKKNSMPVPAWFEPECKWDTDHWYQAAVWTWANVTMYLRLISSSQSVCDRGWHEPITHKMWEVCDNTRLSFEQAMCTNGGHVDKRWADMSKSEAGPWLKYHGSIVQTVQDWNMK